MVALENPASTRRYQHGPFELPAVYETAAPTVATPAITTEREQAWADAFRDRHALQPARHRHNAAPRLVNRRHMAEPQRPMIGAEGLDHGKRAKTRLQVCLVQGFGEHAETTVSR